jgi:hypothetical protein
MGNLHDLLERGAWSRIVYRDLPGLGHNGIALRLDVDPELLVLDTGPCRDLDSPAL